MKYQKLVEDILKPIEKQMPQALTILRLAKQEARRLGRNVVGTQPRMFVLTEHDYPEDDQPSNKYLNYNVKIFIDIFWKRTIYNIIY